MDQLLAKLSLTEDERQPSDVTLAKAKTLLDLDDDILLQILKTLILAKDCANTVRLVSTAKSGFLELLRSSKRHVDFAAVHPKLDALYSHTVATTLIHEHSIIAHAIPDATLLFLVPIQKVHYLRLFIHFPSKEPIPIRNLTLKRIRDFIIRFSKARDIEVVISFLWEHGKDFFNERQVFFHNWPVDWRSGMLMLNRYTVKLVELSRSPSSKDVVEVPMIRWRYDEFTMRRVPGSKTNTWRMKKLDISVTDILALQKQAADLGWHVEGLEHMGRRTRVIPTLKLGGQVQSRWEYDETGDEAMARRSKGYGAGEWPWRQKEKEKTKKRNRKPN